MVDRTNTLTLLEQQGGRRPRLQILTGEDRGKLIEITRESTSIGRTEENDIVFPSAAVSRTHAFIELRDGRWFIRDGGSKNGIQVNGVKTPETPLQNGNLVTVGDYVFRFLVADPPPRPALARMDTAALLQKSRNQPGLINPAWISGALAGLVAFLYLSATRTTTPPSPGTSAKPASPALTRGMEQATTAVLSAEPTEQELEAVKQEFDRTQADIDKALADPGPLVASELTREHIAVRTGWPKNKQSDDKKALETYLREGRQYLADGDFEAAAVAFNFALVLDPNNAIALAGMEHVGRKERRFDIGDVKPKAPASRPAEKAREKGTSKEEKKKLVAQLFQLAREALDRKQYQLSINKAEEIRQVEIPGETVYLNEAKQIIDRAQMKQQEEFEPFVEQAKVMLSKKAYRASRDLCREMLKRDPYYTPAKDCVRKAEEQLNRQASARGVR